MILIVAEIIQKGLTISSSTSDIPYQYSGNIQMQFIKDEAYDNFSVIGFYRTNYFEKTQLLEIDENGVFSLNKVLESSCMQVALIAVFFRKIKACVLRNLRR